MSLLYLVNLVDQSFIKMNFEKRVVGIAVSREGEPIYSELTTHVRHARYGIAQDGRCQS